MSDRDSFQPVCSKGHPIEIISEGHGICFDPRYDLYYAWAFTKPAGKGWFQEEIIGRDGGEIDAWVHVVPCALKDSALDKIQKDMGLRRSLPFDEETERTRLMPV